jgi:hypothetical protein
MLKFLATLLNRMSSGDDLKAARKATEDEEEVHAEVFESLAMTDELREALFPKTTQMVSAIFDRPASDRNSPPPSDPPPSRFGHGLPL